MASISIWIFFLTDSPLYRFYRTSWKKEFLPSLLVALVAYVVFYFGASTITKFFFTIDPSITTQEIAQGFVQAAVFEGSRFISIFAIGGIIPLIETILFFGAALGFYLLFINSSTKFDPTNPNFYIAIIVISALFTVFHLTAKGVTNTRDLFVTFMFGVASALLVFKFQRLSDAIFLHVINNYLAVA